jgi:site-specific recombinase XerD
MPSRDEYDALADSWDLALRAERKAKGTLTTYRRGLTAYAKWCQERGEDPALTRTHVQQFIAAFFDRGGKPTTAGNYLSALRLFVAWCVAEGEDVPDEIAGMKNPKESKTYRPPLDAAELEAMVSTCDTKTFLGKRDEAVLRFMVDTGGRSSEILGVTLENLWIPKGRVLFKGKGDKERLAAFSPRTGLALDRYLRVRRKHRLADSPLLWLGDRGQHFTYGGLWPMVKKRAALAGVVDVHPHRFRRTFADKWLSEGGSVDGLMAIAGWESMEMIKLYAGARANVRALDEHQRLFGSQ